MIVLVILFPRYFVRIYSYRSDTELILLESVNLENIAFENSFDGNIRIDPVNVFWFVNPDEYVDSKDLNIYCTGNIWTNKHFLTMQKSGLYGFRTTSEHTLANFVNFSVQSNNTGV